MDKRRGTYSHTLCAGKNLGGGIFPPFSYFGLVAGCFLVYDVLSRPTTWGLIYLFFIHQAPSQNF
jgi:hypothetical protein